MNLSMVRDDLKTALATITGLNAYDTMPAKPEVPCAVVIPSRIDVHKAFGGGVCDIRFVIQILVQLADWPSAQDQLDGYISLVTSGSVSDAVEAASRAFMVETIDNYGTVVAGEGEAATRYGSVHLNVLVMTSS